MLLKAEIKENVVVIKKTKKKEAIINGDRLECARCGSLLMMLDADFVKYLRSNFAVTHIGTTKCNHRHQGERCGTMNDIYV